MREDRKFAEANFQHLDVVRIKSKEHQGEWAILDVYDEDQLSAVVLTVTGEIQVLLVNLEKIELSLKQKQHAYNLMSRLQAASYNLQGKGEPYGYQTIDFFLKKSMPELSAFEEKILQRIENLQQSDLIYEGSPPKREDRLILLFFRELRVYQENRIAVVSWTRTTEDPTEIAQAQKLQNIVQQIN